MKVAIVGSRDYPHLDKVRTKVQELQQMYGESLIIVSGGAAGVDTAAEMEAKRLFIPTLLFPANWDRYGNSAGARRNYYIVKNSDRVIAFWSDYSRGTKITIKLAKQMGKELEVISDSVIKDV